MSPRNLFRYLFSPTNLFPSLAGVRKGVNHVGMELSLGPGGWTGWDESPPKGPTIGTHYPNYNEDPGLYDWYQSKGFKSARVTFTWEAIQPRPGESFPAKEGNQTMDPEGKFGTYLYTLKTVVKSFLDRGIHVVLAMYQNNESGTSISYKKIWYSKGGFLVGDFRDFWSRMASEVNSWLQEWGYDQHRVAFDLINEPHEDDIVLEDWFTLAQAAINGIRSSVLTNGTILNTNRILVSGMNYGSAQLFVSNGSAKHWLRLNDPLDNLAVTVHCYIYDDQNLRQDPKGLRKACSNVVDWARQNGKNVHIGEIAIDLPQSPPLPDPSNLAWQQWRDWRSFCRLNRDVLIGWNWWANSTSTWWDDRNSQGLSVLDQNADTQSTRHWGLRVEKKAASGELVAVETIYMNLIDLVDEFPFIPGIFVNLVFRLFDYLSAKFNLPPMNPRPRLPR